jgi:hypothetical protein
MVITVPLSVLHVFQTNSNLSLYIINRLELITEVESVYCAVRTESIYDTTRFVFKRLIHCPF